MHNYDWATFVALLVAFVVEARVIGFRTGYYSKSDVLYRPEVQGFVLGSVALDSGLLMSCVFGAGRYAITHDELAVPLIGLVSIVACLLISAAQYLNGYSRGNDERFVRSWLRSEWDLVGKDNEE